jgi:signal transduction histidine kinase
VERHGRKHGFSLKKGTSMNRLCKNPPGAFPAAKDTFELTQATQTSVNDLNQPLTSLVTMFAVFKQRVDVSPAAMELITAMENEIDRMGQITRKLSRLAEDTTRRHILKNPNEPSR